MNDHDQQLTACVYCGVAETVAVTIHRPGGVTTHHACLICGLAQMARANETLATMLEIERTARKADR